MADNRKGVDNMNDYSLFGSTKYLKTFIPLERISSDANIRAKELTLLKNEDETEIDFVESLYRNSNPDYYLGGWIVKAVVDILLEFTIGDLPTIQGNDKKYTEFCNQLWSHNQSSLYLLIKELGLFGQEFCYVGWDSVLQMPRFRPMSKKQVIDIRYENFNDPNDITYVRFRDQFLQAKEGYNEDEDNISYEKVYYDKFFWKELNPKYKEEMSDPFYKKKTQPQWIYKMKIYKRIENNQWEVFKKETINPMGVIPFVEFNQNKLTFDKTGYSDISGAMKIIQVYHQTLESGINNSLYNSQPTLKFTGLGTDPIEFVKRMYGDYSLQSGDVVQDSGLYDVYGSYYLTGDEDVSWLTVPSTVSYSKEITNLLFYILVQVTGVPEWVLGAGMEGAWATVKQQSVPLLQKIRSKRMDITDSLLYLNRLSYTIQMYYMNSKSEVSDYTSKIVWGDVLTEDIDTKLRIVEFMLEHNFITEETAVTLIGFINDPLSELKKAKKQMEKDNNKSTIKTLLKKSSNNSNETEDEDNDTDNSISESDEEDENDNTNQSDDSAEVNGEMQKAEAMQYIFDLMYSD